MVALLCQMGGPIQGIRHLINFLANSPARTYFLGSVDASSEVASANMLANLLK
jgi:hypothetical protein